MPVAEALKGTPGVAAVYTWDATTGQWLRYIPGLPAFVNNLLTMEQGRAYWFVAKGAASLRLAD